jgi:hypothetical protein
VPVKPGRRRGGRDLKARCYCANRSCDQPIVPAERVEQQLAQFLTGFAPNKATRTEIMHRLSSPATTSGTARPPSAAPRWRSELRMRDLYYELGDLHRAGYVARREAINAELSALTPAPIPDLDQAPQVLEDFTSFWTNEADPTAKRQFLSLIFENVWLDKTASSPSSPSPRSCRSSRAAAPSHGRRRG